MSLTLTLNKDCAGYYSKKLGSIEVAVSKDLNKGWTGIIQNWDAIEDEDFILYKCYGETKKCVYSQITQRLIDTDKLFSVNIIDLIEKSVNKK